MVFHIRELQGGVYMQFRDLKVTLTRVEGACSRCVAGTEFEVRNAKLILPESGMCLFALGSLIPCLTAAALNPNPDDDFLDLISEFQCPDPFAVVRFKVEPLEARN
jgi:uncharacterized repeat protein (TIGR04076 family)